MLQDISQIKFLNLNKIINMYKTLRRSRNQYIGGVCKGLADYTGTDVAFWRVFTVLGVFFTSIPVILVYVLMWIFIPIKEL